MERLFAEPLAIGGGGGGDGSRSVRGSMHGGAAAAGTTTTTPTANDSLLASILTANGSTHNGTANYNEASVRKRGHETQHQHQQRSSYTGGGGGGGGVDGEGAREGHVRAGRAASIGVDGLPV